MELYKLQMDDGRYFLHEHLASAFSWAEPEVQRIEQMIGVRVAIGDQSQYEAADRDGAPIQKAATFMANSSHNADALSQHCSCKQGWCSRPACGKHVVCSGERAKMAAIYTFAFCKAILKGFRNQMVADGRLRPGSVGLNCVMLDGGDPAAVEECFVAGDGAGNVLKLSISSDEKCIDDLTGHPLDPALCRAARKKEMGFAREKGLWIKRSVR